MGENHKHNVLASSQMAAGQLWPAFVRQAMKGALLLFAFFLLWPLMGQKMVLTPHKIDSFQQIVRKAKHDTTLYVALYALAEGYAVVNLDSARMYGLALIDLTTRMEVHRQVRAHRVMGGIYLDANLIDSVEVYARKAIACSTACESWLCLNEQLYATKLLRIPLRRRGDIQGILDALAKLRDAPSVPEDLHYEARRLMSYPLLELGDFDESLKELQQVWTYSKRKDDKQMMCLLLGELAAVHMAMGNQDKAIALSKERLGICEIVDNQLQVAHGLGVLGQSYLEGGILDSAYWYYQELWGFGRGTNDLRYAAQAIGGLLRVGISMNVDTLDLIAERARITYNAIEGEGVLAKDLRQFLSMGICDYYDYIGDYPVAIQYAQESLINIRAFQEDTSSLVVDALAKLATVQAANGQYEAAWRSMDTMHRLKMVLLNRTQQEAFAQTAIEMDLAENELARQRAEQAQLLEQQASRSRTRFFILILSVVAVILGVIIWAFQRASKDKRLITDKNQQIEQSLAEKEVLLREIHHRVKNNLQIISSLLDKQARKSSDAAVRKLVREGQERIQSMALIHQNLYESEQLSGIDIKSYLRELGQNIQKSQALSPEQVQLELNVAEEELDIDTAIPVGLILNELLTNCYKYAFVGRTGGTIQVDFKKVAGEYTLRVSDNGVGFRPNKQRSNSTLGLNLVNGLVRQLEGTIKWMTVEKGTAVAITF